MKAFKTDLRKDNPALHLLYTKWAVVYLSEAHKTIDKFASFSNLMADEFAETLRDKIKKLVTRDAAFADALEILRSIEPQDRGEE